MKTGIVSRLAQPLSLLPIAMSALLAASCVSAQTDHASTGLQPLLEVVTADQVTYQPLNPARGDASPQAGVLWGDIRKDVPSGVLLKFADGFSSPPHIHNITYRAVVISGYIHNDDPDAADLWMGPGSYWSQPAGEVHITAAKEGANATAFLEILSGPYLVQPSEEVFSSGEQPVNLVASNLVWLSASDSTWIAPEAENGPLISLLWRQPAPEGLRGSFLRFPAGYNGGLSSAESDIRVVVIQGELEHSSPVTEPSTHLGPGGYFASGADVHHNIACHVESACLLYVRTAGRFTAK